MAYEATADTKTPVEQYDDVYRPTEAEEQIILDTYGYLDEMIRKRDATYPELNDRTLLSYIDDGDKRLNSYTHPRDAYDPPKDEWQSNVALPTIKDKGMKILAGFSLEPPDMDIKAYFKSDMPDVSRADISKWLIVGSYMHDSNPVLDSFWSAWEAMRAGTVVEYEGYMRTTVKQKFIKKYDIETGKIEADEREVTVEDRCFSHIVPLTEFFVSSFYTHDVQLQDRVAWVRNVSEEKAMMEFGRNPMWKYVKTKSQLKSISNAEVESFYHKSRWDSRVDENTYEIVRMYCKAKDSYIILVNGILMLDAPLVWKYNGRKVYPFAKSIWMPFINKNFFYGQSFADHMSGLYDEYNTLWNTMTDNQYRRMVKALLVGQVNLDALNLEDEYITNSTKISVPDVNQVKEMTVGGIDNADVTMLKLVAQALDDAAPSMPSILGNKKATAREVQIANDRLNELKSLYAEMIVDLWRQKYQLRLANIQQNYPVKQVVYNEETGTTSKKPRTYFIEGATLNAKTGEVGTLAVVFDNIRNKQKAAQQIAIDEKQMQQAGIKFKKIIVPTGYLDNMETQITVVASSTFKQSLGSKQANFLEKVDTLQKIFPQYFLAMSETLIGQLAEAYGDNPAQYEQAIQNFKQQMLQAQQAKQKAGAAPAGGPGQPPAAPGAPAGAPPPSGPPTIPPTNQ